MSWEPVDRWPGEAAGEGAFRASLEPKLHERAGPSLREWGSLFWHSTPERPLAAVARRAILTASYLYAERFDGKRLRVARERLHGVRRADTRLVIGVDEGQDLVLPHRARCPLEAAIVAQLGTGAGEAWQAKRHLSEGLLFGFGLLGVGMMLLLQNLPRATRAFHGALTLDSSVQLAAGAVGLLTLALAAFLWIPSTLRVDRLGVELVRGAVPFLTYFLPREDFEGVAVREVTVPAGKGQKQHGPYVRTGWQVVLDLRAPARFGTLGLTRRVPIADFPLAERSAAVALARQVRGLLALADGEDEGEGEPPG